MGVCQRGVRLMAPRGDATGLLEDAAVKAIAERDPDHVLRVLAELVQRLKTDGRYPAEEIEAAALQLCRELGIPPTVN